MQQKSIPLQLIDPPNNPHRLSFDEQGIIDLAKDIRDRGLINPITVTQRGDRYEVVAGHRRLLAHQHLGLPLVECRIMEPGTDSKIEAIRTAENLQRENLTPIEESIQVFNLVELHAGDIRAAAKACHRSEGWVSTRLQLQTVPDELQQLCHAGQLTIAATLQLARLTDPATRRYFTDLAARDGCTIEILKRWVDDHLAQLIRQPDQAPTLPDMPAPGGRIVVYLDCDLCAKPTDVHDRLPKFLCAHCRAIWNDLRQACHALEHIEAQQQPHQETTT